METTNKCKYSGICWREAYSKYLVDVGWDDMPPDRLTLLIDGYATQETMVHGLYAENFPFLGSDGYHNLCPQNTATCYEYTKAEAKEKKKLRKPRVRREWIPREVRYGVAKRARYKCVYCGVAHNSCRPDGTRVKCVVDHVIPLARGGTNDPDNLVFCCEKCNREKGTEVWTCGQKS